MELRVVHCLPDSGTVTSTPCHCILRDTEVDREAAQRLVRRETWDACGRDDTHLRTVLHRRLQGGVRGAQG